MPAKGFDSVKPIPQIMSNAQVKCSMNPKFRIMGHLNNKHLENYFH